MSIEELSQHAFAIKPLGCWLMTIFIVNGGTFESHAKDLARLCGVSPETITTTVRKLVTCGLIHVTKGNRVTPNVYRVAV